MIDSALLKLIEQGNNKAIAVTAFLWSSPNAQQVIVPWRKINSAGGAYQVTDEILSAQRTISAGATATGDALVFAGKLLEQAPAALRRVIDISTNGHANMGRAVAPIRDGLVAAGVTINGLAVTTQINLENREVSLPFGGVRRERILRANQQSTM